MYEPERPLEPREPRAVCECAWCCGSIFEGDEYMDVMGLKYHFDCYQDAAPSILAKMLNVTKEIAEVRRG